MLPLFTFGDLVLDVVARVEGHMDMDTDTEGEVRPAPGGSAANFAVWAARLGAAVRFAGRVGDDMLGRALVADLRRERVEPFVVHDPERPTAVLVLFAQGTQRHMMVPRGANHHFSAADVPEEALRTAGWLHVTGYSFFWEATTTAAERALDLAREAGIPVSFDPSSAGFIRRRGLKLPAGVQVMLPNLDEALALTGAATPEAAALRLGETAPLVAVKLGPEGALLCEQGRLTHVPPAVPDGPVLDTTGAGDCWGAAFITALRDGLEPGAAAVIANRLAARVVARMGARPALPAPRA
ncbi:MAG: putative sugar kinase [Firmicutes bacterium]|nr:putative sugar kinase [Bacillota bacterium]